MATESSAIARFIDLVHQEEIQPSTASPPPVIEFTEDVRPVERPQRSGRGLWFAFVGLVVVGGAIAAGYFLAVGGDEEQPSEASAVQPAEVAPSTPAAGANAPKPESESAVAAIGGPDAATDEGETVEPGAELDPEKAAAAGIGEEDETPPTELDLEKARSTGFDVLVRPAGAKVSLDGHEIGTAPLRVRNLLPGRHVIGIQGADGYFGQHMEIDLALGQSEVLDIELAPVDPSLLASGEATQDEAHGDKADSSAVGELEEPAKKLTAKQRREQKRAERRARRRAERRARRRAQEQSADMAMISDRDDGVSEVALGTLMLGAKPPCHIIVDGKDTGLMTPQRSIQLPEGKHSVLLVNEEHGLEKRFKVRIKAGKKTRAIQDFTSEI